MRPQTILPTLLLATLSIKTSADVVSVELDWKDQARASREVPVKIWYSTDALPKGSIPVIVFSHGLGGSREGYAMWSSTWAQHGYLVINPTHVGSDTSVLKDGIAGLRAAINMKNAAARVDDVRFVLDQVEKIHAGTLRGPGEKELAPLQGKLDLKHIGMAGHSFGAQTTLSIAGETFRALGKSESRADPRVTAAIAMSPQPALQLDQDAAFGSIKIPVMHLTGTEDGSIPGITDVRPDERRIPYDHSKDEACLIIFKGATHMTFAPLEGTRIPTGPRHRGDAAYATIHQSIKDVTIQFWDAYLKENPESKIRLREKMKSAVGDLGAVEFRPAG